MSIANKILSAADARADRRRESIDGPREEVFSKLAGPARSLDGATGSLPVSSAKGFVHAMEELHALEAMGREIQLRASRLMGQFRAEMERANVRQPEENEKLTR